MFICGYHFPADEGNDVAFDKVIEKVDASVGDVSSKTVTLKPEDNKGVVIEEITVQPGTFVHKALVDFYQNADVAEKDGFKMVYYTNKYQISEISKSVDGESTKELCKKLDDMNLYRVKVS